MFAEEGGYHVNADNVHLKGGAIASSNPQASELRTNKLTFEDIHNESSSKAMSASISGNIKETKEKWLDNETGKATSPNAANSTKIDSQRQGGINPSLPMYERSSDSSITRATLTEGTIILNKDMTPTQTMAAELGINTDITQANQQVAQTKDVKAILAEQQQIASAIGNVKSAVDTYTSNQQEAAEQEVRRLKAQQMQAQGAGDVKTQEKITALLAEAEQSAQDWGTGGKHKRLVDMVTAVITSAIAGKSGAELTTTALSPLVNQKIKEATTDNNTGEVDKTTNAIAHAVWGAIEAAAAKGNVTAGAASAAGAELAAPLIAKALYGTDNPKALTETQKQNIVHLSSLAGAIGSGIVNGSSSDNSNGAAILTAANQGAEIGKRAVENNAIVPIFGNVRPEIANRAEGQIAKDKVDKAVMELIQKEHPVIYQTAEGAYYFVSSVGKVVYVSREVMVSVAPMLAAPELVAGKAAYKVASQVGLGLAANAGTQIVSGQPFNWYEFAGAGASAAISPKLKTANDVIRVNMGIGMATGMASGGDPIEGAGLAGLGTYAGSKVSNPIAALVVSEVLQKIPTAYGHFVESNQKDNK